MNPEFDAWITTRALTKGIEKVRVMHCLDTCPSGNMVSHTSKMGYYYHGEGKSWHRTPEGAKQRAEAMRKAKIASLKKSISRLEKLTFEV